MSNDTCIICNCFCDDYMIAPINESDINAGWLQICFNCEEMYSSEELDALIENYRKKANIK